MLLLEQELPLLLQVELMSLDQKQNRYQRMKCFQQQKAVVQRQVQVHGKRQVGEELLFHHWLCEESEIQLQVQVQVQHQEMKNFR